MARSASEHEGGPFANPDVSGDEARRLARKVPTRQRCWAYQPVPSLPRARRGARERLHDASRLKGVRHAFREIPCTLTSAARFVGVGGISGTWYLPGILPVVGCRWVPVTGAPVSRHSEGKLLTREFQQAIIKPITLIKKRVIIIIIINRNVIKSHPITPNAPKIGAMPMSKDV